MPAIENLAERVRLAGADPAFRLAPHNIGGTLKLNIAGNSRRRRE
jgi:hypothetical protein